MTITESRLRKGELTLGTAPGKSFACQATNVRVTPSYADDGDAIETLCGDTKPPGKKETWVVAGTSVQDFDDPQGFLTYCHENSMLTVPFAWKPNDGASPNFTGDVVIVALEEGGDVNSRLTTDWEFAVSGKLTRAYSAVATGATSGAPGAWTPSGSTPPATVAALTASSIVASPATAWASGQYVQTGTAGAPGEAHWTGAAWAAGRAP